MAEGEQKVGRKEREKVVGLVIGGEENSARAFLSPNQRRSYARSRAKEEQQRGNSNGRNIASKIRKVERFLRGKEERNADPYGRWVPKSVRQQVEGQALALDKLRDNLASHHVGHAIPQLRSNGPISPTGANNPHKPA